METVFRGEIRDGKISFVTEYNSARFRQWAKEHDKVKITIKKEELSRSKNQNAFYWLYLGIIEQETGNEANDLHEFLKRTLLAPVFISVLGKEIKIPRSTSKLNKIEFGVYLEKICALTGVPLPDSEGYNLYQDSAPMINE
jgi:hypothetical protein